MIGRAELIQTTLTPIILYWMLVYYIPSATIIKLDKICFDFFWAGKTHKISCSKLCRSKLKGGIDLKSFQDLKRVSILKLI